MPADPAEARRKPVVDARAAELVAVPEVKQFSIPIPAVEPGIAWV